jgi:hypothetical protein
VGDLIPEGDEHFGLILKLLDIMDVLCCPINALEDTVNLSKMIEEFFATFKILFPDVNPLNKFHHLIHYPEIIDRTGRRWDIGSCALKDIISFTNASAKLTVISKTQQSQ